MLNKANRPWYHFVNFAFVYLQLIGMANFRYDKKHGLLVSSVFWAYYCAVVSAASISLIAYEFANEILDSDWLLGEKSLSAVSRAATFVNYASVIFSIGKQWCMKRQFKNFICRLLFLERKLFHHLEAQKFFNYQPVAWLILKFVIWVFLIYLEIRMMVMLHQLDNWRSIFLWFMASIVWHIGAAPLNVFYVIILCITRFYNIFNSQLRLFASQMELASAITSSHNKMWEYCKLSDVLDTYTSLSIDIHNAVVDAVDIFQFQSLAIFGEAYINLVGRMYLIFLLVDATKISNEYIVLTALYILFSFLTYLLPFFIVTVVIRETEKSVEYGKLGNQFLNLDERLERNVLIEKLDSSILINLVFFFSFQIEIFTLLLTLKGDKIKFGGLVHINRALILSAILSAVAHLLLLIQFYRQS